MGTGQLRSRPRRHCSIYRPSPDSLNCNASRSILRVSSTTIAWAVSFPSVPTSSNCPCSTGKRLSSTTAVCFWVGPVRGASSTKNRYSKSTASTARQATKTRQPVEWRGAAVSVRRPPRMPKISAMSDGSMRLCKTRRRKKASIGCWTFG